jgi:hypothetical protein
MWVFEEKVGDKKLTDIINTEHENVKYLPGAKFTPNLRAGVYCAHQRRPPHTTHPPAHPRTPDKQACPRTLAYPHTRARAHAHLHPRTEAPSHVHTP